MTPDLITTAPYTEQSEEFYWLNMWNADFHACRGPVPDVLAFLPRSWMIVDNLEFLPKILDFLKFLPRSCWISRISCRGLSNES